MKKIIVFVLALLIYVSSVSANGCCSWHGGISYCSSDGYYICNDGTKSPTCHCSTKNDKISEDNECNVISSKVQKYQDQIENLKNELSVYTFLFWTTLIVLIIYVYYKNH